MCGSISVHITYFWDGKQISRFDNTFFLKVDNTQYVCSDFLEKTETSRPGLQGRKKTVTYENSSF